MSARHKVQNTGIFLVVLAALFGESGDPFSYTVLAVGLVVIIAGLLTGDRTDKRISDD